MRLCRLLLAGVLVVLAAGCSLTANSGSIGSASLAPAGSDAALDAANAEQYCTNQGGMLVDRQATANTNGDPATWLPLAGKIRLCEFETGTGSAATRISVDLVTLYSEAPTLAAVAYLSKLPPATPPQVGQNPAAYNCTNGLGGASDFGNALASGGGWVDQSQPTFVVMNLCVFADMSAIDEWGITYYANGTIRGADLAQKMRYQPNGRTPQLYVPLD